MIEHGRANDMPWERSVVFITSNVGTGLSMQIAQDRAKVWLCSNPPRRVSRYIAMWWRAKLAARCVARRRVHDSRFFCTLASV